MRIRTTLPLLSLCLVGACSSNAGTGEEITGTSAQAITADYQGRGDQGEVRNQVVLGEPLAGDVSIADTARRQRPFGIGGCLADGLRVTDQQQRVGHGPTYRRNPALRSPCVTGRTAIGA